MGHIRIAATRSAAIKVIQGKAATTTKEILFNYDILLSEHLCKNDKTFILSAVRGPVRV